MIFENEAVGIDTFLAGKQVVGFRDSYGDDLEHVLFSISDLYTVFRDDAVLASLMEQMHERIEVLYPPIGFFDDVDVDSVTVVYLRDLK